MTGLKWLEPRASGLGIHRASSPHPVLVMTFGTWGGWRPGAGRKPSKRRNNRALHRKRPKVTRRCPVHITLKVHRELASLRVKARCQVIQISSPPPGP